MAYAFNLYSLPYLLVGISSILMGIAVLKGKKDEKNIVLFIFMVSFAAYALIVWLAYSFNDYSTSLFWYRTYYIPLAITFGAGFHFVAIYPHRKWIFKNKRYAVILFYLPYILLWYAVYNPSVGVMDIELTPRGYEIIEHPFSSSVITSALVVGIIFLIINTRDYFKAHKYRIERTMYKFIAIGLAGLVIGSLMSMMNYFIFGFWLNVAIVSGMFVMLFCFAYVILKYQLLDIQLVVRKWILRLATALFIGIIAVILLGLYINFIAVSVIEMIIIGLMIMTFTIMFYHYAYDLMTKFIEIIMPWLKWKECKLEEVFLIQKNGLALAHKVRKGRSDTKDSDIVAGMLTSVQDFISDSFPTLEQEKVEILHMGHTKMLVEHAPEIYLAVVFTGYASSDLRRDVKKVLNEISDKYDRLLDEWDGDLSKLKGIDNIIEKLFPEGEMEE